MGAAKNQTIINTTQQSRLTEKLFIDKLISLKAESSADNSRFFKDGDKSNKNLGVRMSAIFALAKQFMQMPLNEIEQLLESEYYEARMGAVSIMDFQARDKKISAGSRKELYDLYVRRHDRNK